MHTKKDARSGTFLLTNIERVIVSHEVDAASTYIFGTRASRFGGIQRAHVVCNSCGHEWLGAEGRGLTPSMSGAFVSCPHCCAYGHCRPPVA